LTPNQISTRDNPFKGGILNFDGQLFIFGCGNAETLSHFSLCIVSHTRCGMVLLNKWLGVQCACHNNAIVHA
jgi:hypothetical protein